MVISSIKVRIELGSLLTGDIRLVDAGHEDGKAYDGDNHGASAHSQVMGLSNPSVVINNLQATKKEYGRHVGLLLL